ncbi:hypothetical protein JG688_00016423 [Phytophthora aleatoria]|uniref:Uncharacterized protein n=1 Tax=Phytophthora aleatoria TaxID=2496075 RepID=A0A8J5MCV4_9STRA|nr:hypothetical protein JG688_00016423 [Phytophthora aleatoria]
MMKGRIGNKLAITTDTQPHLAIIIGQVASPTARLEITERQKRVLCKRDLNLDALNVVNLLSASVAAPIPQKRAQGEWVDENYSGGALLSYDMIRVAVKTKSNAKAAIEADRKVCSVRET